MERPAKPKPGFRRTFLYGVAATSSKNAWAVGTTASGGEGRTIIEHWGGKRWKIQPSPTYYGTILFGVAATSSKNAWAVGYYYKRGEPPRRTVIEHWGGKRWKIQPSPNPGRGSVSILYGVAATSATNAWAVGEYYQGTAYHTLIEHWDGKTWKVQRSPNPGSFNELYGVAAASATNAWAVGRYGSGSSSAPLALHWDGSAWKG